jgi:hypothetical protein
MLWWLVVWDESLRLKTSIPIRSLYSILIRYSSAIWNVIFKLYNEEIRRFSSNCTSHWRKNRTLLFRIHIHIERRLAIQLIIMNTKIPTERGCLLYPSKQFTILVGRDSQTFLKEWFFLGWNQLNQISLSGYLSCTPLGKKCTFLWMKLKLACLRCLSRYRSPKKLTAPVSLIISDLLKGAFWAIYSPVFQILDSLHFNLLESFP